MFLCTLVSSDSPIQYTIDSSDDESASCLYLDNGNVDSNSVITLTCSFLSIFRLTNYILHSFTNLSSSLFVSCSSTILSETVCLSAFTEFVGSLSSLFDLVLEPISSFISVIIPQSIPTPNPNLIILSNVALSSKVSSPNIMGFSFFSLLTA